MTENRKVTGSTPVGATVPFPGFYREWDFFCFHAQFSKQQKTTVPQHPGDIPKGTLHAIEKDLEEVLGKGWLK